MQICSTACLLTPASIGRQLYVKFLLCFAQYLQILSVLYVAALQMLASSPAAAYRGCLGVLPQPCLQRLVAQLALQGEASPLSVRMLDLNGAMTHIITSVDHQALSL
jgi:hypothetical protein